MNQKIIVEVRIPSADMKKDVILPLDLKGNDVVKIISKMFGEICKGKFQGQEDTLICIYDTGKILDINKKIIDQDITNGTVLILI